MVGEIVLYNNTLETQSKEICEVLRVLFDKSLTGAKSKIWHKNPVWFIDENPLVGYSQNKAGLQVLFWSGQSFNEPGLKPSGSFKAANIFYKNLNELDLLKLETWLSESLKIQWDYKNIVKNKGNLTPLTGIL